MNPAQREQVRLSLLRFALTPLSASLALSYLRAEGLPKLTRDEVELEINYLVDKKFMELTTKSISPENRLWRTTAEGRDLLALQGE